MSQPGDEIAPSRYRKKPVVIEAILWCGTNLKEVIDFTGLHPSANKWTWEEYEAVVKKDGFKIVSLHRMSRKVLAAFDRYMNSPFRRRPTNDVETLEWAIALLEKHPGVQVNPNSQYWLERLRALAHYAKLDRKERSASTDGGNDA